MAKHRIQSSDIASILGKRAPADPAQAPDAAVPFRIEGVHPVRDRSDSGIARADNTLILHPKRVVRRGRYVRPFTDDRRFHDLIAAIQAAGNTIHVPILVRTDGPPGAIEYVLVDGTHRLEAARRLNITVPAINLGRLDEIRALAIQAMSNEVRASMHVVDQAAYVAALNIHGLSQEEIQQTIGFSAGRVSELLTIGMLFDLLTDVERDRARRAVRVTYRALRAIKAANAEPDAFRHEVMVLVEASEAEGVVEDEDDIELRPVKKQRKPVSKGKGDKSPHPGLTFVPTKNSRGTSVTYRVAWRARAVRSDPEAFLMHVREVLEAIAIEATAQYEHALTQLPRGKRPTSVQAIANEEAEIIAQSRVVDGPAIPEDENPMPMPPSRRRDGDDTIKIDPALLSGLSLPMLTRRIKESRH